MHAKIDIEKKKGKEKYCYNDVIVDQFAPVSKIRTSHRRRTGIPNGNWDRKNREDAYPPPRGGEGFDNVFFLRVFTLNPFPLDRIYISQADTPRDTWAHACKRGNTEERREGARDRSSRHVAR